MRSKAQESWTTGRLAPCHWVGLDRFLQSQDATRELVVFCQENVSRLDEGTFIARAAAKRRLLEITPQESDAAYELIENHLSEFLEQEYSMHKEEESEAGSREDVARRLAENSQDLFSKLRDIVPGRNPLSLLLAHSDTRKRRPRLPLIMSSLLISMVSDFEVLFGHVAKTFMKFKPEALITNEKNLSWADLAGYESLDEFRDHYIDQQVERLLRESLDEWLTWLRKKLNITIENILPDLDDTRKVFQRRHIAVHNDGKVSRQYLIKLPNLKKPPSIGDRLPVDSEYMLAAMDKLIVAAVGITASIMRKTSKDHGFVDELLSKIVYDLLRDNRNYAVVRNLRHGNERHHR